MNTIVAILASRRQLPSVPTTLGMVAQRHRLSDQNNIYVPPFSLHVAPVGSRVPVSKIAPRPL